MLSLMTKNKKPYFHNNWQYYKDADDNFFSLGGNIHHTFEDIMDWKVGGYELPSSVCCIIRATDPKTKKVKEYVYSKLPYAMRKIEELMDQGHEFIVCDEDQIQAMYPE